MKFLILVLVAIALATLSVVWFLSEKLLLDTSNMSSESVATSTSATKTPDTAPKTGSQQAPSFETRWVPPGFRGPTEEPKIIGPSGNPPNY